MKPRIRVAVLFGGRSAEHEISLLSAQNVLNALNTSKYEAVLIGIDKNGRWYYQEESLKLLYPNDPKMIALGDTSTEILFSQNTNDRSIREVHSDRELAKVDVIFPVLHGTYGEDGAIQGLARLANIPCVGPGILGSAVGMDKDIMKRLLRDAGIAVADFITLRPSNRDKHTYDELAEKFGREMFIKPANLGSSVGISLVKSADEFWKGIDLAFEYDQKVIVEEKIIGREIECAVLGNESPLASIPGEIIPKNKFYSYEAKYVDEEGARLEIPAKLTQAQISKVQHLALETFEILDCHGMARVDMFLTPDDSLIINEINTIPGFTNISMYPSLWKESGLPNEELVDRLIQLAMEYHQAQNSLRVNV
jgi:D-alanine-D-alanine ligase